MADDQTLSLGNYEEVVAGDWNEDQCYQGSWWMIAPTQFYVKHTGSQFIYTKEQLAQMAGKEVKGMSFVFYNQSSFSAIPRTINVWVKEIDDDAFAYNDEKKAYAYFDFDDAEKVLSDYTFDTDFVDYYCQNGELNLAFDKAFAYSGDKNLLVTITFDGDETAETSSDIEFYYNTDAENMAMSTNSDNVTFADYHESEDWPYAKGAGYTVSHATQLAQPLTQFTYQEAAKPEVKPAELTGTVSCDGEPIMGATVTLTSGETKYEVTSDAEGKYTLNIEAENVDKEYTLTAKAAGYEDYTIDHYTFASGETKTQDITMRKIVYPSVMTGTVSCDGEPIMGATVTLTSGETKYEVTSDAEGKYTLNIEAENVDKEYTLTAKAAGYEDYTIDHYTFASGETKTQDITMRKIVYPSVMTGTVSCDGEPQEGAVVKLTATDDSKLVYKATTGTDGTYRIKVVKSDKTYTLEVTCGGCEDYSEKNVTFTPGEDTTKNIIMTKTPEPENSITLGKYDKMLADGTGDDVYVGHGYSWAAAPTNFSHSMTGSQIIYTKEQLAKMGGKAITQVNFIFRNECAYGTYPRTVKVWAQEIDDANFDYDDKACLYMFYDYKDATVAVAGMEYAGELYDLIGNGELEIAFDKPINYSGNKNLLLTFTFEGTECCNTLDFNFFYNADMPKKAMSYFSDRRSFDEYAESVDWPYVNDDCTPKLEQPITRFFYTDAVTDNIDSTNSGNRTATGSDAMYNLAGQRVSKTYKGIVVKNGKKYVN
uniref:carboxypeptidase-like regulatory domain-containing protein n=1 Tax=Prevotella sp. TaxID=59823 RepID=UPI003FEE3446